MPDQYTEFALPPGQLYLLTSNWVSDQSRLVTHACVGDVNYNALADLDGNGCVELSELAALLGVYGEPC